MEFYAFHGVYDEEKAEGNRFSVDVEFDADLNKAANSDDINDTLNYEIIYNFIADEMKIPSNLLENVVERVFYSIKSNFIEIKSLKVRVTKHNPPLDGKVQRVSVEKRG